MVQELPVEAVLPDVLAALRERAACVLVAPTGAGKTTRLPPALEDAGLGPVVVLEPRRLAARAAARRVAKERKAQLGGAVGYHVRFDRCVGPDTTIRFVTEGVFIRQLQSDPFLEGVGSVVLDEFHERSLDVDLALALVRRVQLDARPELKLVVTSATLDAERIAQFLDDAPIVRSEGRLFPVEVEHLPAEPNERDTDHLVRAVRRALDQGDGDVLAFLPGVGEIRRAHEALETTVRARKIDMMDLFGDLEPQSQDAVLERGPRRKVVLATNVAESSVTVPGVTIVVDTGLSRTLRNDPAVGLDRLVLGRISMASAEQRRGRAGREAPGLCLRLWSAAENRTLAGFDEPEIRRADLTASVLQLLAWGERDLAAFPWLERPKPEALQHALDLARMLGAVAGPENGPELTELGRVMVRVPAQPRLARLLVAGHAAGILERAALAAALLGERDPWRRDEEPLPTDSDVLERVRALERFDDRGPSAARKLRANGARACLRAAAQLERIARSALGPEKAASTNADDALLRALLAAFPDRLSRRRPDDPERAVLAGGRGVRLSRRSGVSEGELFLSIELDAGKGEALVHQASVVEREWVDGGKSRIEIDCVFDPERRRVVGRKRVLLGQLVLDESAAPIEDRAAAERVLVESARADLARALDLKRPEIQGLLARIACLREWVPELELPVVDEELIAELLPELAHGCRSFDDLARSPLVSLIVSRLSPKQAAALERDAPERIPVPSGSRIRLLYEAGKAPVLAARIQELFGLSASPRVGGGRVNVLLHLLAPNGRPQQVTDDLASFWSKTYFDVRKELRRRYPKHDWPDDPTSATATSRPRRRPKR